MTSNIPLARELMSTEVVTVPPDMPVTAIARLLLDRHISAVPVLDAAGRLAGLVTEADLLRRIAAIEDKPQGWLSNLLGSFDTAALAYARSHGRLASDVMTRDVVTVAPEASAAHCAQLMEKHRIKRLPVADAQGRLLGVIARADLLRAALEPEAPLTGPHPDRDARIRAALRKEMRSAAWADSFFTFTDVREGVVTLQGYVRSEAVRRGLLVMASRIEGVARVVDETQLMPRVMAAEVA
jgi:CBS domain-containing protein